MSAKKSSAEPDPQAVLTAQEAGVLRITLNRPDSLNALNGAMLAELLEIFKAAEKNEEVRCIILTGAGRGFCSGQDLSDISTGEDAARSLGDHVRNRYNPLVRKIRSIEKPVIASLNGVAAGAGASLALACDLRIASEEASFVEAFVRVGLVPDSGGTYILPALVGYARAAELAFTGRKVDAREAERIGLVNRVVGAEELAEETWGLATELAALPTRAIGMTKRAFNLAVLPELDRRLEYEADLQQAAAMTEDHREGVQAFMEKRRPDFRGR